MIVVLLLLLLLLMGCAGPQPLATCPEDLFNGQLGWSHTCCHEWQLRCAI